MGDGLEEVWTERVVRAWLVSAWTGDAREKTTKFVGVLTWPSLYIMDSRIRLVVERASWAEARGIAIDDLVNANRATFGSRDTFDRCRQKGLRLIAEGLTNAAAVEARLRREGSWPDEKTA